MPAVVAVKAKEAVGQDATAKVGAERLLDETRTVLVSRSRAGEEGLELVGDGPMEERLFRRSPGVRAQSGACRGSSMGSVRGAPQVQSRAVGSAPGFKSARGGMEPSIPGVVPRSATGGSPSTLELEQEADAETRTAQLL